MDTTITELLTKGNSTVSALDSTTLALRGTLHSLLSDVDTIANQLIELDEKLQSEQAITTLQATSETLDSIRLKAHRLRLDIEKWKE